MSARSTVYSLALGALGLAACGDAEDATVKAYTASTPMAANCESYCSLMTRHCRRSAQMYPNYAACQAACPQFANDPNASIAQSDTLQCRVTYAFLASQLHGTLALCLNAGPTGGQMCR